MSSHAGYICACRQGLSFVSFTLEPAKALPLMYTALRSRGVTVKECVKVEDLSVLSDSYDVLVNCTGAGSSSLVCDANIK